MLNMCSTFLGSVCYQPRTTAEQNRLDDILAEQAHPNEILAEQAKVKEQEGNN